MFFFLCLNFCAPFASDIAEPIGKYFRPFSVWDSRRFVDDLEVFLYFLSEASIVHLSCKLQIFGKNFTLK